MARPISVTEIHATKYGDGQHWQRVHDHLLAPALRAAGFNPISPEARGAHDIHGEIIKHLMEDDLVLADFSTLNPNVMFEAGIRTSMQKPLVIVAENGTALPFDTGAINTLHYDPSLRVDTVAADLRKLTEHIEHTDMSGNGLLHWFKIETTSTASLTDLSGSDDSVHSAQLEVLLHMVENIRVTQESERQERLAQERRIRVDGVEAQHRHGGGPSVTQLASKGAALALETLRRTLLESDWDLLIEALRSINAGDEEAFQGMLMIERIAARVPSLAPKYANEADLAMSTLVDMAESHALEDEWLRVQGRSRSAPNRPADSKARRRVRTLPDGTSTKSDPSRRDLG